MNSFTNRSEKSGLAEISTVIQEKFLELPHSIITPSRDEVIFHQGDKVEKMGFILDGVMKCCKYTFDGDEVNTRYFYKGEIFPEYLFLTGEGEYIYNLVTEKDAKLLLVDTEHITQLIKKDLKWNNVIIDYMAWRGLLDQKWALCNSYGTLKSSIAYMLLEIFQVQESGWTSIHDSQQMLATKLQVSRPMFNQALIKLEKEGLIERKKTKIRLKDRSRLEMHI